MIEIDGSRYSGSGTIVRQAVTWSALTGRPVHIVNARIRRPSPGLRLQHIAVVEAIRQLVNGEAEGLVPGSREVRFTPGVLKPAQTYLWEIGSAGSATMLAMAVLPLLAFAPSPVSVEVRGGLFQDFAPSFFHFQYAVLPLLRRMGLDVEATMVRPGYVPKGQGVLSITVKPVRRPLSGLKEDEAGPVRRLWGIALASHLAERRVSQRMADAARNTLAAHGYQAEIELQHDTSALQPGAALALFADLRGTARLGADQAGALRRPAEAIGRWVAGRLLEDLATGATLDRFAADQIIPFAALAQGESRFFIPAETEHVLTNIWLTREFVGSTVAIDHRRLSITGVGYGGSQADQA